MKHSILLVLIGILFNFNSQAQEDYKQYLQLSYAEIDSLLYLGYNQGTFSKVVVVAQAGREKARKDYGEVDSLFATYCEWLGILYKGTGQYMQALPLFSQAKDIREKTQGKEHPEFTKLIGGHFAILYGEMGNYAQALQLLIEAKEIQERILGKEHPEFARTLNNIASMYLSMGDYTQALPLYIQAKNIWEKVLGKEHPDFALALNNAATVYYFLGDYDQALSLYTQAKNIREKEFGKEHPIFAQTLNNLAALHQAKSNYTEALALYTQSKEIREKSLGSEHPEIIGALNNLATLYQRMGDYDQALPLFLKATSIREKILGKEHPDFVRSLNNLASLYYKMGDYAQALPLFIQTKGTCEKILSTEHPEFAKSLIFLASSYQKMHNYVQAEQHFYQALPLGLDYLSKQGNALSEKAKQNLFKTIAPNINTANYFAAFHRQHDSILVLVQNGVLLTKGYALTGVSDLLPIIKSLKDSTLEANYNAWIYTKQQLGKAYEMSLAKRAEKGIKIDSLERAVADQESALMQASAALRERLGYNKKRFYYSDLLANLAKNEVAIDFVRFENEKKDTAWYYALVSQQGWAFPKFIPLCTEAQLLAYTQTEISPDIESYITNTKKSKELYNLIIQPLEPYLKKIKNIHWAPVGLLNQVAMGTLRNEKNKMLSEVFAIHQYSSLKDFIINKSSEGKTGSINSKNVLLVGDVAFDLDEKEHQNLAESNKDENLYVSRAVMSDSTRGASRFVRLAGTKVEIDNLNIAFKSKKWQIERLQEKEALEEKVREYSGDKAPSVLHFATHGFFIPAKKQGEDNPLLRSGIALAGANRVWLGKPRIEGVEDGLWTAYEVANSNLLNTNLVVLSACETARGYIDPHEGVVGLQRSFKIAGVDNMLLSLWQVPDKETVELMQEFYKYYLDGKTAAVSLRKAQAEMRKLHPDPYYWAAFILIE